MTELRALLALELRSLYGLNSLRYTRDPKAKKRYRLLLGVWVLVIAMVFSYVGGLVYGLCSLGLGEIVPACLTVLASLLILVFGFFTAGNRIFGQKGYDLLAAMPIRSPVLVLSRFLSLYGEDLVLTGLILLPGVGVYGVCRRPAWGFYPMALLAWVLIPAIPLVASVLLGTLVLGISARMKRKSLVQTVLMLALVILVLIGSFSMGGLVEGLTPEAIARLAQTLADTFGRLYPPALWLGRAMVELDLVGLGLFSLVSLGVMALAVAVTTRSFHGILRRLRNVAAGKAYQLGAMESRSLLKALYIREARRYFSSSIYVTNTILGPIMGSLMSIALCVTGLEPIRQAMPGVDLPGLLPFVLAAVFCMMSTTCTSISMEGKGFAAVKALPIPTGALLDSKLLLNLSLMLPNYIVSVIAMTVALRPDALQLLWLVLIPGCLCLFTVVVGITVNLKFHSFDWEKEETVVKQSLPAALGGFAGPLMALVMGGIVLLLPGGWADGGKAVLCLAVLGLTALLYGKNNRAVLSRL